MPLTTSGKKILEAFINKHGKTDGTRIFYAYMNKYPKKTKKWHSK